MNFKLLKVKNLLILSSIAVLFTNQQMGHTSFGNENDTVTSTNDDAAPHSGQLNSGKQNNRDSNIKKDTTKSVSDSNHLNNNNLVNTTSFFSSSFASYSNINGNTFEVSSNSSNHSKFDRNGNLLFSNTDKNLLRNYNNDKQEAHTKRKYHHQTGGTIDDQLLENGKQTDESHNQYSLNNIQKFWNYQDNVDKLSNRINKEMNELFLNNQNCKNNNKCTDLSRNKKHNKNCLKKHHNRTFGDECIGKNCNKKKFYNKNCTGENCYDTRSYNKNCTNNECFDEKCYGTKCINKNGKCFGEDCIGKDCIGKNCDNDKKELSQSSSILENLDSKDNNINTMETYSDLNGQNINQMGGYNSSNELLLDDDKNIEENNKELLNTSANDNSKNKSENFDLINDNKNDVLDNNDKVSEDNFAVNTEEDDKPLVTDTIETKSKFNEPSKKSSIDSNTIPLLDNKPAFKAEEYKKFSYDKEFDKMSTENLNDKSSADKKVDDELDNGPIE